jgi:hypothetical protein
MKKRNFVLLLLLVCIKTVVAQRSPANNAILNFTQVMFRFDEIAGADSYILTISPTEAIAMKETKHAGALPACLVTEGLDFGNSYQWFYQVYKKGRIVFKSEIFTFLIKDNDLISKYKYRYTVTKKIPGQFTNNLLFIENLGVIIDRKGKPVWYLPYNTDTATKAPQYRNMEITKDGTFTFVSGDQCYEKNIFGETVWKAPDDGIVSGDAREHYHHDFKRLDDGTYIACSYKFDTTIHYLHDSLVTRVRYNTVIQYDAAGKVLWSWFEKDHVAKSEIFTMYPQADAEVAGTHMNGFDFDKKTNSFIFSFRDNSSILRIDKSTGNILYALMGDRLKQKTKEPILFNSQHSPSVTKKGTVLIYNNNAGRDADTLNKYPVILDVDIPVKNGVAKTIWSYECKMNDHPEGVVGKEGSVFELPNKNLFICVGGANKIFEVTRDKKVVWEMNCEEFSNKENKWVPFTNYRSHYLSSLYPYYFTAQNIAEKNTLDLSKPIAVRIGNEGTENDEYAIEVFSSNVLNDYAATVKLSARTSVVKTIRLTKNKTGRSFHPGENYVVVRITPLSDPALKKEIIFTITK